MASLTLSFELTLLRGRGSSTSCRNRVARYLPVRREPLFLLSAEPEMVLPIFPAQVEALSTALRACLHRGTEVEPPGRRFANADAARSAQSAVGPSE